MITISQIKKIHILKNIIGLDDETYLKMLKSFDVITSKKLTLGEATILIDILEEQAIAMGRWQKRNKKYSDLTRSNNMASGAQLRMIEAMWREISYFDTDKFAKKSLRKYLKQKFKTDDIMFLTKTKANKVIHSIKEIKKNLKSAAAL